MNGFLKNLQSKGIRLGICSNNNEFWFRRQMDTLNLYQYFNPSGIILSCRVGVSKSSKRYEMFHTVVKAMGLLPSELVYVDDRDPNVQRAKECGMEGFEFNETQGVTALEKFLKKRNG